MLKRKLYDDLLKWKNKKEKKCLLIKGARQVGKTYLVEHFGKKEYKSYIEINFYKEPTLKNIFNGDLSAEEIYKKISAFKGDSKLIPGNTLIFLDEIQRCSKARTALKFLSENMMYDVIASGSLLGLSYGQDYDSDVEEIESIPVGYEEILTMYSLDFEEYLWANGYNQDTIDILNNYYEKKEKIPTDINNKFLSLAREYMVVGGMPEVVDDFIHKHDFNSVHEIQSRIINDYKDDIVTHAKGTEKNKIKRCYESIPSQLAKENKKFKYSLVEPRSTSRKYGYSVNWICDSNLANPCYNVSSPTLSLKFNEKIDEFKLYINDTGLLLCMAGLNTKLALLQGKLLGNTKGGIYENFISETLIKKGYTLHYFKPNQDSKIEFIIEKNGEILPIEVKAGNSASVSLNRFIEKFHPSIAIKFIDGNIGLVNNKLSLPHYLAMFL